MTKKTEIIICDACGNKIPNGEGFYCKDVPNEGCSYITHKGRTFEVGGQDYCCFECLVGALKKELVDMAPIWFDDEHIVPNKTENPARDR